MNKSLFCCTKRFAQYPCFVRCVSTAVAFDVDGVLVRGGQVVPSASKALKMLRKRNIPFIFMTNGGGRLESTRASDYSKKFGLQIREDEICQSHTPMRSLASQYEDKLVLLVGKEYDQLKLIAKSYGFRNYVTVEDFHRKFPSLYPDLLPVSDSEESIAHDWLKKTFGAVITFTDPLLWGREIQICCDILRAKNGCTAESVGEGAIGQKQTIPLFTGCADFEYAAEHPVPRFGSGAFQFALQCTLKELIENGFDANSSNAMKNDRLDNKNKNSFEMNVTPFGKPHLSSYKYVREILTKKLNSINGKSIKPNNIYMIGDNPYTDILGARNAGKPWTSILTRSGLWKDGDFDGGADYIVDDVEEAIQHIIDHANE